jgi:hypothetical protein
MFKDGPDPDHRRREFPLVEALAQLGPRHVPDAQKGQEGQPADDRLAEVLSARERAQAIDLDARLHE